MNTETALSTGPVAPSQPKRLDFFERYLSLWVFSCMIVGVAFGKIWPGVTRWLSELEFGRGSHINIPIAVLIWLMIYPMMLKIDFGGLKGVATKPKGLLITLFVNWLVKPFSMALLGWLFVQYLFSKVFGWIDPETAKNYTAGLIILAAAPCTAMVFVWSYLTDGDGPYTLAQVAINDLIMIFAFAPIVMLLVGVSGVHIPGAVLFTSVDRFHRNPAERGLAEPHAAHSREGSRVVRRSVPPEVPPGDDPRVAGDARADFRLPIREHFHQLDRRRAYRDPDPDPGVLQFQPDLWADAPVQGAAQHRYARRAHRREQFLRTGRRRGNHPLRPDQPRCARHGRRGARRGAGDAFSLPHVRGFSVLV